MPEERHEDYEELYLSNIESQNKMVTSEIAAFTTKMRNNDTIHEDILSMIRRLGEYERYFLFINPIVEHFAKAGKPQLSQRLEAILNDIRCTVDIFQQATDKKTSDIDKDQKMEQMSEEEKATLRESIFAQTAEKN